MLVYVHYRYYTYLLFYGNRLMGVNWHTKHMCYSGQLATKWRCVYVKRDDPQHSHSQSMSVARGCSSTKEKCGRRSVMGPTSQLMITYGGYIGTMVNSPPEPNIQPSEPERLSGFYKPDGHSHQLVGGL